MYFLREALRKGIISYSQVRRLPVEWLKYKLGRPNMNFIEDAVKYIAGIEEKALEETAEACFNRYIKQNIYRAASKLIKEAQERAERVIFATSSILTIVRPLERFLGIEKALATTLEFCGGKTTGKIAGNSFFGLKKKTAVEAWLNENNISLNDVSFYSDSYTDLPLLEICGRPVAVNPDMTLARNAKKRGWEILRFREVLGEKFF